MVIAANIFFGFKFFNLPVDYGLYFLQNFTINSVEPLTLKAFFIKGLISLNLHGDYLHLFSNMLFLYTFGFAFVEVLGGFYFLILYYGAGFTGWFVYRLLTHSSLPTIGASGAISGLMAAYLVLFPRARLYSLWLIFWIVRYINVPAWGYVGFWIILQYFLAIYDKTSFIAYEVHLGGILFGLAFGALAKFLFVDDKSIRYDSDG